MTSDDDGGVADTSDTEQSEDTQGGTPDEHAGTSNDVSTTDTSTDGTAAEESTEGTSSDDGVLAVTRAAAPGRRAHLNASVVKSGRAQRRTVR